MHTTKRARAIREDALAVPLVASRFAGFAPWGKEGTVGTRGRRGAVTGLELVNVSASISLAELSLPICGPRLCGQVRGIAPSANVRLDVFGPYLSGSLGISIDCAGTWFTDGALLSGTAFRYAALRGHQQASYSAHLAASAAPHRGPTRVLRGSRPRVDGGHVPHQAGEDRASTPDRFIASLAAFLHLIPVSA